MTDQELDIRLRKILLDATERERECAEKIQLTFQPSKAYQRSIKRMLKNPNQWANRRKQPVRKQGLRTAAAVFLVIILAFGSILAISPTARATAKRWVEEWYETHVIYRYSGDRISGNLENYQIADLPSGYEEDLNARFEWDGYLHRQYQNKSGDIISFTCFFMNEGLVFGVDGIDDSICISVNINGMNGTLYLPNNTQQSDTTLTWIDPDANIQFIIDAMVSNDDILHMAESVSLCKVTK